MAKGSNTMSPTTSNSPEAVKAYREGQVDSAHKAIRNHIQMARNELDFIIMSTPTGPDREAATIANILLAEVSTSIAALQQRLRLLGENVTVEPYVIRPYVLKLSEEQIGLLHHLVQYGDWTADDRKLTKEQIKATDGIEKQLQHTYSGIHGPSEY
jgi:hypothetical protein